MKQEGADEINPPGSNTGVPQPGAMATGAKTIGTETFPIKMISAVLDKGTFELMVYRKKVMRKTKYRQLYRNSYAKEIRRLS